MSKQEVENEIVAIFKNGLSNSSIDIKPDFSAKDIEEWDSLTNIHLLVACERRFKVKFKESEVIHFKKLQDLIDCIHFKLV